MRVTLVQPPSARFDVAELAPPLSLLSIAAQLELADVDVTILDLNLRCIADHDFADHDFYGKALAAIAATEPDVVGMTSMALESHVCLELARRIKTEDPATKIVVGGPHFGAIANEVLSRFACVDYVVCGEGEIAMAELAGWLRDPSGPLRAPNVAYRSSAGIRAERVFKPLRTLDELPSPAYHLVDLQAYFGLNPRRTLDYEHARGCQLRCTFCYSPDHWGHGEQAKSIDRILADLEHMAALGAGRIFFVADNFLNAPSRARALCREISGASLPFHWNCYATLAQLTPETVEDMAGAGCDEVFVGVDAVSDTAKRSYSKTYFRGVERLVDTVSTCVANAITPTCAFLVEPPSINEVDSDQTLRTALEVMAAGARTRLNSLALYPGSTMAQSKSQPPRTPTGLVADIIFDTHPLNHHNPLAARAPGLFPLHEHVLAGKQLQQYLCGLHFAYWIVRSNTRTFKRLLADNGGRVWHLMGQLGGLDTPLQEIHPTERVEAQRAAFERHQSGAAGFLAASSAAAVDGIERRLGSLPSWVRVAVSGTSPDDVFLLPAFETVKLDGPIESIDRDAGCQGAATSRRPAFLYAFFRVDNGISYLPCGEDVYQVLNNIGSGLKTGEPAPVVLEVLDKLVDRGIAGRLEMAVATEQVA